MSDCDSTGPDAKRARIDEGSSVDGPEYSMPGSTVVASSLALTEQLPHPHDRRKVRRGLQDGEDPTTHAEMVSTATQTDKMTYEDIKSVADYLLKKTKIRPEVGIVCGSGLGGLADDLDEDKEKDVFPYKDIPKFPETTVKGHKGNLVFGYIAGHPVVCMQGRFHFYEGHPPWKITMPIRVMKLLGVKVMVVTNAAGGLNPDYNTGDIMIMKDHINLAGMTGANPLIGENEERFGPRFPAMTTAYDRQLREFARQTATDLGMDSFVREGVYVHLSGPNYETPSESMFLHRIGADAVGMSTAPEVTVARHSEIKVLGMSLITNMVILEHDSDKEPPNHKEVMDTADQRAKDMCKLVKCVIEKLTTLE